VKAGDKVMAMMMAMIHLMVKNGGVFRVGLFFQQQQ